MVNRTIPLRQIWTDNLFPSTNRFQYKRSWINDIKYYFFVAVGAAKIS
jgi:hypothetical protein